MNPFSSLAPGAYFTFRSTPRASFQIWVEIESFELETIKLSVILRNRLLHGSLSLSSQGFNSHRKSFFIKVSQKKSSHSNISVENPARVNALGPALSSLAFTVLMQNNCYLRDK